jgi:hypothetical protein
MLHKDVVQLMSTPISRCLPCVQSSLWFLEPSIPKQMEKNNKTKLKTCKNTSLDWKKHVRTKQNKITDRNQITDFRKK